MGYQRVIKMEHAPKDAEYYQELYYRCLSALPHEVQRKICEIALPLFKGPDCTVIEVNEVAKLAGTDSETRNLIYEAMQSVYGPKQ